MPKGVHRRKKLKPTAAHPLAAYMQLGEAIKRTSAARQAYLDAKREETLLILAIRRRK